LSILFRCYINTCKLCQGCTNPGRLNFVRWRLVYLGTQYRNCFQAQRILRCLLNVWTVCEISLSYLHLFSLW
jgi:hypothetical protein